MSPYIIRSTTVETPSIFAVKERSYLDYIPPEEYDERKHVLADLTPKQIAEVQEEYPGEYDEDGNYIGGQLTDQQFLEANWQEAVRFVGELDPTDDADRLQELAHLERDRDPSRSSVVSALKEQGVAFDGGEGDEE